MTRISTLAVGLALVGLFSVRASAGVLDFTPFGGYTTVTMGDVNREAQSLSTFVSIEAAEDPENPISAPANNVGGAWIAGGDLLTKAFTPWKSLSLGLRGEYLATNSAEDSLNEVADGVATTFNFKENGTLSGALLGGRYELPGWHSGLDMSVGVFGGFGYGTMAQQYGISGDGGSLTQGGLYSGEGFIGDLDLRLGWQVPNVKWLRVDAQCGYRYASLGDFSDSRGHSMDGSSIDKLVGLTGSGTAHTAVDVDFSGISAEGALTAAF